MKIVYISGKISGLPVEEVKVKFKKASDHIISIGCLPSNPLNNGLTHSHSWEQHMRRDIEMLMSCDAIYMLSDWNDSKGATIEHHLAHDLGMDIIYQ